MAELVDADPTLDPDTMLNGWPTALWDALVFERGAASARLSLALPRAQAGPVGVAAV